MTDSKSMWMLHEFVDRAGFEGLIRYHQGNVWISFSYALVASHSSEHAETINIWGGFRQAERFGYTHFTLESDYKAVIDQLLSQSGLLGTLRHVHRQIFTFVNRLDVVIYFVQFSANILAHLLASQTVSTYPSNVWMEVVPPFISTTIQADLI